MTILEFPIFEAVRAHHFVGPAFNTKLQLADRTNHHPSTKWLVLPARQRSIKLVAAMRT
jgi:hypothetical protein